MTKKNIIERKKSVSSITARSFGDTFRGNNSSIPGEYYDLYRAFNYPILLNYSDFVFLYRRQDIAHRIVRAPVEASWSYAPSVEDNLEEDTVFEDSFYKLAKDTQLYYNFYKVDLLAMIGRYSVLYLGFDDAGTATSSQEVVKGSSLVYVTPISEPCAQISTWQTDPTVKRFGLPEAYKISFTVGDGSHQQTKDVHWSRLIHVAVNTLESETYGIPALNNVYNRLLGLEKIAGGSPEGYHRGARPGYTASAQANSVINQEQLDGISDQLSSFSNDYTRWIFTQGLDIKALAPQVVDPTPHADVQLQLISAATGIPKRILTGSERGELASTQDERNWLKTVEARRHKVLDSKMLSPFIDRMIEYEVIPKPANDGYTIVWEPLVVASEKEKAEIGLERTKALSLYSNTPGANLIVPEDQFKSEFLNMSDISIEQAKAYIDEESEFDQEEDPS